MENLATRDLAQACRIFMKLAYPDGAATVPERLRSYCDLRDDQPITDLAPTASLGAGVTQDLSKSATPGYAFRLGSAKYPHLKLKVQRMEFHEREVWVYSVDTHDRFIRVKHPNEEEAEVWRQLVEQNRQLKHQIEEALAQAGFLTPTIILKLDLTS